MKKTIHKNYSLLVLVLLILYMTYINLPADLINNMRGGNVIDPNNPYLGMDDDKLVEKLAKYSTIFSLINNYFYVYCGLIGILLGLAGYFASTQYQVQGAPMLGSNPGVTWENEGMQFLNFFYLMSKQKYGLFTPSNSPNVNPKMIKTFEDDFDDFILTDNGSARAAIDTFCNVIAPCNICSCNGPDPNYAGAPENTPMIPFKGKCPNFGNCTPVNDTGKPSPADASASIIKMQEQRGVQDLLFGRIPNCCCQLWKSQLGAAANFTAAKLTTFINALPNELGLSSASGCEPSKPNNAPSLTGQINGVDSTIIPFTSPSGTSTYIYDMVVACGKKDKLKELDSKNWKQGSTNTVVNSVSPEFMACANYNLDLDEGVSPAHVAKNAHKYITPSIGNGPPSTNPADVSSSWTSGIWTQTTGKEPTISVSKPTQWPSVVPFTAKGTVNNHWYKSSSGIMYQLNVNNRLFEIGAYPVREVNKTIYPLEVTDTSAKTYLDSFLSTTALAANKEMFVYGGAYYFP